MGIQNKRCLTKQLKNVVEVVEHLHIELFFSHVSITALLFLFFFKGSGAPRILPSSPTRLSSDLEGAGRRVRPQAKPLAIPDRRSSAAPGGWRKPARHRAHVWPKPLNDLAIGAAPANALS